MHLICILHIFQPPMVTKKMWNLKKFVRACSILDLISALVSGSLSVVLPKYLNLRTCSTSTLMLLCIIFRLILFLHNFYFLGVNF
jgi:hypothetical protein